MLLMTYNPQYYDRLIQAYGNTKWKDLLAWLMDNPEIPERLDKIMPRVEAKASSAIRTLNFKDFKNEIERFNATVQPVRTGERHFYAHDDAGDRVDGKRSEDCHGSGLVFFAEVDGKTVGVSLAVPDFNVGLKAAQGRLLPFGFVNLLMAKGRSPSCA